LVRERRTTKIKDIRPGPLILKGRVELIPGEFLHTPIEKIRVVHFLSYLQKVVEDPFASRWQTIQNQIGGREFLLSDDTGRVIIDPIKADVDVALNLGNKFRIEEMPPQFSRFLRSRGIYEEWKKKYTSGHFRYAESILTANENIYVMGNARKCEIDEKKVFYQDVEPYAIEGAGKRIPFIITDGAMDDLKRKLVRRSAVNLIIAIAASIPVLIFVSLLISELII
jgi:hypothetical protein